MPASKLWSGPLAAGLFIAGTLAIGAVTPGYSLVRQTVSELGEVGSPGQAAFTALLCLIAVCLLVQALAVARSLRAMGLSGVSAWLIPSWLIPSWLIAAMAISCAGVGVFSFPHPLHNVFGMSETLGLQAPLAAAIACRKSPRVRGAAVFSILMYALVVVAIAINIVPLVRPAGLWVHVKPVFGLVQRSLFLSWFAWSAGFSMLLLRAQIEV